MRTYNVSLEQCLVHVVKARPCVLPNDGFLKQLILYDRFLVDRRRKRQEENLKKAANEIPPEQATNETNSQPQPVNADPIHVIPIQVSPAEKVKKTLFLFFKNQFFFSVQIETIPIKKIPVEEGKIHHRRMKENTAVKSSSKSSHSNSSKKRQSALITTIIKPTSSHAPRSHSAHTGRTQGNHHNASSQQWNVSTYYPNVKEEKPTKYITEIYDKATNRFIPANC